MTRVNILLFGFGFCFLVIIARLFYWQIIMGEKLKAMAESQQAGLTKIEASRGKIYSADLFPLVSNEPSFLLFGFPRETSDAREISARLAPLTAQASGSDAAQLETEAEKLESRLSRADLFWVSLARNLSKEKKESIEKLDIDSIGFEQGERRAYPEASIAAQLLGFVGSDQNGNARGYFGLEGFYQRILAGREGEISFEKDARGRPILLGRKIEKKAVSGDDLVLYLERPIQFLVENKLKEGMQKYNASAGLAVIMDPESGGVLAMASFPSYDPKSFTNFSGHFFSNPVISETFEPGSIFKPLVMAAALEERAVSPDERCSRCDGPRQVGEYTIRTWNEKYHPDSTMAEIIQHSDNVGMAFVSEKLGTKKLVSYLKKFGIDKPTGIDLEGETVAPFREEKKWLPIDLATASFGQGVALTPIQMVRAIAAIANGGRLMEPHVVAKIQAGEKEIEIKPKVLGKVVSEATAKAVTEMMVNAAERGGTWKRPAGRIAGKTGTAQIPISGHYDDKKTIVSFVGFAPADNPRFVMLVSLREPTPSWGSMTVAPLWFEIAEGIFHYFGISP